MQGLSIIVNKEETLNLMERKQMNDKTMKNLQTYIGKRSLGQSDAEVIEHIQKVEAKEEISQEEWKKLAYPSCANSDVEILKYIFGKVTDTSMAKELILHTVRFRQKSIEYQLKQAQVEKYFWSILATLKKKEF